MAYNTFPVPTIDITANPITFFNLTATTLSCGTFSGNLNCSSGNVTVSGNLLAGTGSKVNFDDAASTFTLKAPLVLDIGAAAGGSGTGKVEMLVQPIFPTAPVCTFNLGHHSFPNGFGVTRDNEVYAFGYNVSEAGTALNAGDDSLCDVFETNFAVSGVQIQFERHLTVRKKAGGEARYLSFAIQKWNSTTPYDAGAISQMSKFTFLDGTGGNQIFQIQSNGSTPYGGQVATTGLTYMQQSGNSLVCKMEQLNAANDIITQFLLSGASKWRQIIATGSSNNWVFLDDVGGFNHTVLWSNGGMGISRGLRCGDTASAPPTDGSAVFLKDVVTNIIASNANSGFLYATAGNNAPTGVPTRAGVGGIALYYDLVNNFLYVYNGGWKKSTVYA